MDAHTVLTRSIKQQIGVKQTIRGINKDVRLLNAALRYVVWSTWNDDAGTT
jgi:hypothetical protein